MLVSVQNKQHGILKTQLCGLSVVALPPSRLEHSCVDYQPCLIDWSKQLFGLPVYTWTSPET